MIKPIPLGNNIHEARFITNYSLRELVVNRQLIIYIKLL